jgi:serine/threonine protein kinase
MWKVGEILEGRYRVKRVFTGGAMGIVYQARHLAWDIDLAIKHPRSKFLQSSQQRRDFESECETWSRLGLHPYLATCFYTREIGSLPCVVAEFVEGGSLGDWIADRRLYAGEDAAIVARIVNVTIAMAWGLDSAHDAGLIHCDMKPGNVLMANDGTAKISDFGLAKELSGGAGVGFAPGWTPAYASPEQLRHDLVGRATDIWSWAVSVLEMFTGGIQWQSGPVAGAALEEFGERGRKAVGLPPMPEALFDLLSRCLRFKPAQRPASFAEIADELCEIYDDEFGEPCDAQKPDLELVASDSLNNRAVSLLDMERRNEAEALLRQALTDDPQHPEATFNLVAARKTRSNSIEVWAAKNLQGAAAAEPGNEVPPRLLAELQNWLDGKAKIPLAAVFAKPRSGSDFNADVIRFRRLMDKTDAAITESRWDDARRYARMCGDIEGFGRHPRLRRIHERLSKSP